VVSPASVHTPTSPHQSDVIGPVQPPSPKPSPPLLDTWKKFVRFNGNTDLELMYQLYVADTAPWGHQWLALVCAFVNHEEARGETGGAFPSPSRLLEVKRWISGGRRKTPALESNFGDRLTAWWRALQLEGHVPFTAIDIDSNVHIWTKLTACGANRFLSFVSALLWWRQHAENVDAWMNNRVQWTELLVDIQRVMEFVQHTEFEPSSKQGKKGARSLGADEPPRKRYDFSFVW
jgi:hypothetical protein